MSYSYLVTKKSKSTTYFHFRSLISRDLISYFNGTKQFQVSLINVKNSDILILSLRLNQIVKELYTEIRIGMKNLTLDDIKKILRKKFKKVFSIHIKLMKIQITILKEAS